MIDERKRVSFGSEAALYEEARPSYPDSLIDDIIEQSGISSGDRILEIGAGTGKATAMFASRGQSVLAVEPGKEMAEIAERKFRSNPKVQVQQSKFEDWDDRGEQFGVVAAAQSFHWVDPAIKYHKSAAVLKPGGHIALFWNIAHGLDPDICKGLDKIYQDYFQNKQPSFLIEQVKTNESALKSTSKIEGELKDSGNFSNIKTLCYIWSHEYKRAEFLNFVNTHSDHLILDAATRNKLFLKVGAYIDSIGGKITYPFKTELHLAEVVS
jgi:ubiquinone/menaquinone biosynthesis C-methylase UbiE